MRHSTKHMADMRTPCDPTSSRLVTLLQQNTATSKSNIIDGKQASRWKNQKLSPRSPALHFPTRFRLLLILILF